MPPFPVKRSPRKPVEIDHDTFDVVEPRRAGASWLSFHYSSTVVTTAGNRTRVRSRTATLSDGKLTQESFEGELPGHVYGDVVAETQRQFARQAELLLKSFSLLLPFGRRGDRD